MTQRITITVPNELYQRLQSVKYDLNVSAICQDAIAESVLIEEIKNKDISSIEKLTERLRIEKLRKSREWQQLAIIEGRNYCMNLSYSQFKLIETSNTIDEDATKYIERLYGNYQEKYGIVNKIKLTEAFIDGILSVWIQVKNLI